MKFSPGRHYHAFYNVVLIRLKLGKPPFTVRTFTAAQHWGFIWGIFFFALFVVSTIW